MFIRLLSNLKFIYNVQGVLNIARFSIRIIFFRNFISRKSFPVIYVGNIFYLLVIERIHECSSNIHTLSRVCAGGNCLGAN